eukprot:7390448-Prymnesium_polylepis.3
MVSAGFDRELLVWSLAAERPHARMRGHFAPVMQLQLDESNIQVISLAQDETIRVWDMRTMRCIQVLNMHDVASAAPPTTQLRGRDVALSALEAGKSDASSTRLP